MTRFRDYISLEKEIFLKKNRRRLRGTEKNAQEFKEFQQEMSDADLTLLDGLKAE